MVSPSTNVTTCCKSPSGSQEPERASRFVVGSYRVTSKSNRQIMQRVGGQSILGEKLSGSHQNEEALSRPGRFRAVTDNLHIKEVQVGEGTGRQRYVIANNPKQAEQARINPECQVCSQFLHIMCCPQAYPLHCMGFIYSHGDLPRSLI